MRPTNRPTLLKVFVSRIPDGRVPAAGFAPETAIIKLRPWKAHYKICTGCFTHDEWFMTLKKTISGSFYYAVTRGDDLLFVRDQDLERRDHGHVPQQSFESNMFFHLVHETLRIGVPL